MKLSIFVLVIITSFNGFSQPLPSEKEIYDLAGQFIHGTDSTRVLLSKHSDKRTIYQDTSAFLHDTTYFSEADFAYFRLQLKGKDNFKWDQGRFKNVRTISQSKVKWIFRDMKGWKRFHKKYPKMCLRSSSIPLFNVDKTYCIFYQAVQCGGLSGQGSTNIYKLENGKWIYVDSYGMWVS
ncbi:hypothetical protein [Fluviicola sp.]|uniref:hypothetical protein n=1 Tax=Fluviicola sp. TaxID=1917219 RepID=UPI003D269F84